MTAGGDQAQSTTPAAEAHISTDQAHATQQSPAVEQRVHLYEAVSARRDQVLNQFAGQRAAILKVVAEQRVAALAPVLAVQTKREAAPASTSAPPAALPGATSSPTGDVAIGAEIRRQTLIQLRRAVASDIVSLIKTLVAAEVRAQLAAMEPATQVGRSVPSESDAAPWFPTRATE